MFASSSQSLCNSDPAIEPPTWKIKLLYDSACPLCMREVNFLRRRDADRGLVAFIDITAEDYNPADHAGVEFAAAMGRIHAVLPNGDVIQNVEVFRRVYQVLGMGWIYVATAWPVIGPIVDRVYEFWADRRLALTGRPDLATILRDRQQRLGCAVENRCQMPENPGS